MEKLNICKTEQQRICWKNGRVLALENWTLMEGCMEYKCFVLCQRLNTDLFNEHTRLEIYSELWWAVRQRLYTLRSGWFITKRT